MIRGRVSSACVSYLHKISKETNEPDPGPARTDGYEHELMEQPACLEAVNDPSSFLWPEDVSLGNETREEVFAAIVKIRTPPLRHGDMEALKSDFVLPAELLSMLRRTSTYAEGAELLAEWKAAGLILPREPYSCDQYERLSLDEYAGIARVRCFGHTQAVLENIDHLIGAFKALPSLKTIAATTWASVPWRMTERLNMLKQVKITAEDTVFVSTITDLLKRRESIASGKPGRYCAAGMVGVLIFLLLYHIINMSFGEGLTPADMLFLFLFVPLTLGAIPSVVLFVWLDSRAFSKVEEQILEECDSYLSMLENWHATILSEE